MTLDNRTVVLTASVVNIAPAIVFYFFYKRVKGKVKGTFLWFISLSLILAGSALIVLRGAIPDLISILMSNILLFTAFFLLYVGFAQFLNLRPRIRAGILILLSAVVLIGMFTFVVPSVKSRIFVYSSAAFLASFLNGYLLLTRSPLPLRVSARLAAVMNLGQAGTQFYRILIVLPAGKGNDLFSLATPDLIYLLMNYVFYFGLCFSLFQLVNAQLVVDLESSLSLQKTLLREVRHRTKNNLTLVDSLIRLQLGGLRKAADRGLLETLRKRVRAIGLVYDGLDLGGAGQSVRAEDYIAGIIEGFRASFARGKARVEILTDIEPLELESEVAVPLGLIVNELVTNAWKHAFPRRREGKIRVGLRTKAGTVRLTVRDDGIGLSGKKEDGLGMTIIQALAKQLEGKLTIVGKAGTSVELAFKIPTAQTGRRSSGSGY